MGETPKSNEVKYSVLEEGSYNVSKTTEDLRIPKAELDRLKTKYSNLENAILDGTKEELNALKKLVVEKNYTALEEALRKELIEDEVDKDGVKAVSIDNVTAGIKNNRLENAKKTVNKKLDAELGIYDFLGDRKEMVKLVILDKIIQNPVAQRVKNYLESITNLFKDPSRFLAEGSSIVPKGNLVGNDVKDMVANVIKPYTDLFNKINKKIIDYELGKNTDIYLTSEQKTKLISHIDFFNDPTKLEGGFKADDILKQIDDLLANPSKFNNPKELTDEDKKKLVEYMLVSREHIESTLNDIQKGDKLKDMALNIGGLNGSIGKMGKGIIEFLLKIPILGGIIASFLGLDPERAVDDFNEQISTHKTLKALKTLGIQKDKDGSKIKNGEEPFEGVDLSAINHNETKGELKRVNEFKNSLTVPVEETKNKTEESKKEYKKTETPTTKPMFEKDSEFWNKAFSDGIDKDGGKLKFEFTDKQKQDGITSEEFNEIIKKGFDAFEVEKTKKRLKKTEVEAKAKTQELNSSINELNDEIVILEQNRKSIQWILDGKYKNNGKWSSLFPFGFLAINGIKIKDIVNNNGNDFNLMILKQLGINENSNSTTSNMYNQYSKKLFNNLFILIREYTKDKKDIYDDRLKKFFDYNKSGFDEFIIKKLEGIESEIKQKTQEKETKEKERSKIKGTTE